MRLFGLQLADFRCWATLKTVPVWPAGEVLACRCAVHGTCPPRRGRRPQSIGRRNAEHSEVARWSGVAERFEHRGEAVRVVTDDGEASAHDDVSTLRLRKLEQKVNEHDCRAPTRAAADSPGELRGALVLHPATRERGVGGQEFAHPQILDSYAAANTTAKQPPNATLQTKRAMTARTHRRIGNVMGSGLHRGASTALQSRRESIE